MRVFIYEFVTGGGLWDADLWPPLGSLLTEGQAMVQAIASDFCSLPNVNVWTTCDCRLSPLHPPGCSITTVASTTGERRALERLASQADWTLLIAPETAGALALRCERVEAAGGRLLSPSSQVIRIAADKQATAKLLANRGIPVPSGIALSAGRRYFSGPDLAFPAVLKPIDGCDSQGVRLIHRPSDLNAAPLNGSLRLEEYIPGLAASVAVLCGPAGNYSLPACQQRLSSEGRFTYLGGRLPLAPDLDKRARRLAEAAIAALPQPRGYLGVDLVLGDAGDGSQDRVIEINPRLTTSYVGLRVAARTNLAGAMLAAATGPAPDLRFSAEPIEFTANGRVS